MKKLLLALAVVLGCVGCQKQPEAEAECAPCVGDACPIGARGGDTLAKAEGPATTVKTSFRKIPLIVKIKPIKETGRTEQINQMENQGIEGMRGEAGNYNTVKLPGAGHSDLNDERPFLVRSFKKSIWPGGIPLEAEIDPDIMNF